MLLSLSLCAATLKQARWGQRYANTTLFSGGMTFSDGGRVVEDKMLRAVVEQGDFLAAFTGKKSFQSGPAEHGIMRVIDTRLSCRSLLKIHAIASRVRWSSIPAPRSLPVPFPHLASPSPTPHFLPLLLHRFPSNSLAQPPHPHPFPPALLVPSKFLKFRA